MKSSFLKIVVLAAVFVLTVLFSLGNVATACVSAGVTAGAGTEYIVVFRSGITWEEAASEVAAWGGSYRLADITSKQEQKYIASLLSGVKGEFWTGGYEDSSRKWNWTSGEAWAYTNWARGEPDDKYTRKQNKGAGQGSNGSYSSDAGHYLAVKSGLLYRCSWYDETDAKSGYMTGFIVERTQSATPVPIPPTALFMGSGAAVIGFLRLRGKRKQS